MFYNYTLLGIWIVFTILAFVMYHKIFDVVYLSLRGLLYELLGCAFVGCILTYLILNFWEITLMLIILAGLFGIIYCKSSTSRIAVGIITIILAIMIVFTGKKLIAENEEKSAKTVTEQTTEKSDEHISMAEIENKQSDRPESEQTDQDVLYDEEIDDLSIEEIEDINKLDKQTPVTENMGEKTEQYICPQSDIKKLTVKQVKKLSKAKRRLAKNEIYARNGRKFNDQNLQEYFDNQDWYVGVIEPEDFDESVFNKIEKYNVKLLAKYE